MTEGPVLETERLRLTPYGIDDYSDCAALWGDAATLAFIGNGQPLGAEEVWSRVLRYIGHWYAMGFGYWAVRERHSGAFVGGVGFQVLRRAMEPPLGDRPEMGWMLIPAQQGRGFAREAVAGALAWADAHLAAPETVCIIRPGHARSHEVARQAGFQRVGSASHHGSTTDVFARPRHFPTATAIPTS